MIQDRLEIWNFSCIIISVCAHVLFSYINIYMLGFKFILGLKFFELVSFYLPLFQIMEMNTQQKKIKIELVLKILHQN